MKLHLHLYLGILFVPFIVVVAISPTTQTEERTLIRRTQKDRTHGGRTDEGRTQKGRTHESRTDGPRVHPDATLKETIVDAFKISMASTSEDDKGVYHPIRNIFRGIMKLFDIERTYGRKVERALSNDSKKLELMIDILVKKKEPRDQIISSIVEMIRKRIDELKVKKEIEGRKLRKIYLKKVFGVMNQRDTSKITIIARELSEIIKETNAKHEAEGIALMKLILTSVFNTKLNFVRDVMREMAAKLRSRDQ